MLIEDALSKQVQFEQQMKQKDKKKKMSQEQQYFQFQSRLCELLEIYCKKECEKKEFISFFLEYDQIFYEI